MALFRKHRGSLKESLETTVIVHNKQDICNALNKEFFMLTEEVFYDERKPREIESWCLTPDDLFISPDVCYDSRIGWYTQYVRVEKKCTSYVIGMISEPLIA